MSKFLSTCFVSVLMLAGGSSWAGDTEPDYATALNLYPTYKGKLNDKSVSVSFRPIVLENSGNLKAIATVAKVEIADMHFEAFPTKEKIHDYRSLVNAMNPKNRGEIRIVRTPKSYGNLIDPKEGEEYVYKFVAERGLGNTVKYSLLCEDTSKDPMSVCPSGTVIPLNHLLIN